MSKTPKSLLKRIEAEKARKAAKAKLNAELRAKSNAECKARADAHFGSFQAELNSYLDNIESGNYEAAHAYILKTTNPS